MQQPSSALLHLMHLVSPALPVGAYAYSQGLEYAIEGGWIKDQRQLVDWLSGVMQYGLQNLDLPVLAKLIKAWEENDEAQLNYWNDFVRASRETHELLLEDEQLGQALSRLLAELEVSAQRPKLKQAPSYVSQFALAAQHWQLSRNDALTGYTWSWLENQVAAATKLVPLGQTQAQKLLVQLMPLIPPVVDQALHLDEEDLGMSLPGLALASALHERQYSRLFRS